MYNNNNIMYNNNNIYNNNNLINFKGSNIVQ